MSDKLNIALAGNPNCGKTTLFNELTGSNGYVGNWPGVPVEKKMATWKKDTNVTFVDLPGIYSLSPYSPEEVVSRDYVVKDRPDAVIDLIDVTNIERNLYLTTQILETGRPVVVGLNMCDLLAQRGETIDTKKLSHMLGVPVVEVSALRNKNLDKLVSHAEEAARKQAVAKSLELFSPEVEHALAQIADGIKGQCGPELVRWYSIKVFERDAEAIKAPGPDQGRGRGLRARHRAEPRNHARHPPEPVLGAVLQRDLHPRGHGRAVASGRDSQPHGGRGGNGLLVRIRGLERAQAFCLEAQPG